MPIHEWTRVGAGIFHHFHVEWIAEIARALNAGVLPSDHYALAEQVTSGLGPDVLTLQNVMADGDSETNEEASGGVAIATAPPKVRFTASGEMETYARRRRRVVIRHSSGDKVIAMIELTSPGNKKSRSALRSFVSKAEELLGAGIHLLIIDLFPPTSRDPQGIHQVIWAEACDDDGFKLPEDKPLTLVAYSAGEPKHAYIEPVAVGDRLPDMPLFLTPEIYVPVPLESTYQRAWEAVPRRWREVLEPPPVT